MNAASLVFFTDLDGTLLDHETYDFRAARPALDRLGEAGIPLVLCTSKTRAEVDVLRAALDNRHPFIVENGGGIHIPSDYFPFEIDGAVRGDRGWVVPLGDPYVDLVRALARASRESGVPVRGFADMSDDHVAAATGLGPSEARRARIREFDEPFEVLDASREADLVAAIEREGKRWVRGGRFHHITGASDKAAAVQRLIALFRRQLGHVRTVGLGDAPNDASFLSVVDVPVIIPSAGVERLQELVPHARVAPQPGPVGWNDAVLGIAGAAA